MTFVSGTIPTPEAPSSGEADPSDAPTPAARSAKLTKRELALITGISLVIAFAVAFAVVKLTASDDGAVSVEEFLNADDQSASESGSAEVGERLPNLELQMFDDTSTTIGAIVDRPTVINLWASTCPPCLREMPDFEAVHQDLGDEVGMLGIDSGESKAQGAPFAEQVGVTYPLAEDPDQAHSIALGLVALPMTLFVDADGTLAGREMGAMDEAGLRSNIEKYLGVTS